MTDVSLTLKPHHLHNLRSRPIRKDKIQMKRKAAMPNSTNNHSGEESEATIVASADVLEQLNALFSPHQAASSALLTIDSFLTSNDKPAFARFKQQVKDTVECNRLTEQLR